MLKLTHTHTRARMNTHTHRNDCVQHLVFKTAETVNYASKHRDICNGGGVVS